MNRAWRWFCYYAIGSTFVTVFTWPMLGFPILVGWFVQSLNLSIGWFWVIVLAHTALVIAAFVDVEA